MSKPVHSIECDQILDDATSVMASTGASLLIVTKQGQPVGILTARDLALAPKRCETCLPATLRVTNGEGEGAKHTATIRQLSHVGALIESRSLLLPGTTVVLSFILPGADLSFSVRGTILNSSYEPDLSEDGELIGQQSRRRYPIRASLLVGRIENSRVGASKFATYLGTLLRFLR